MRARNRGSLPHEIVARGVVVLTLRIDSACRLPCRRGCRGYRGKWSEWQDLSVRRKAIDLFGVLLMQAYHCVPALCTSPVYLDQGPGGLAGSHLRLLAYAVTEAALAVGA